MPLAQTHITQLHAVQELYSGRAIHGHGKLFPLLYRTRTKFESTAQHTIPGQTTCGSKTFYQSLGDSNGYTQYYCQTSGGYLQMTAYIQQPSPSSIPADEGNAISSGFYILAPAATPTNPTSTPTSLIPPNSSETTKFTNVTSTSWSNIVITSGNMTMTTSSAYYFTTSSPEVLTATVTSLSSPSSTSETPSSSPPKSEIGIIVGATIGGLCIIALLGFLLVTCAINRVSRAITQHGAVEKGKIATSSNSVEHDTALDSLNPAPPTPTRYRQEGVNHGDEDLENIEELDYHIDSPDHPNNWGFPPEGWGQLSASPPVYEPGPRPDAPRHSYYEIDGSPTKEGPRAVVELPADLPDSVADEIPEENTIPITPILSQAVPQLLPLSPVNTLDMEIRDATVSPDTAPISPLGRGNSERR
jgi:hypothetical protein